MYKFRNRIGIDGDSSILSSLPARIFFCKGIAVITKRQIPCRKSSSNKLSVFSALNLPYWAASTLIKAKNPVPLPGTGKFACPQFIVARGF